MKKSGLNPDLFGSIMITFVLMRILILFFFHFTMLNCLIAQSSNPFEIKDRLDSIQIVVVETTSKASEDSVVAPIILPEIIPVEKIEEEGKIEEIEEIDRGNPFEVDHVPLRKSKLIAESAVKPSAAPAPVIDTPSKRTNPVNEKNGLLVFFVMVVSLILLAIVASTRRSLISKLPKSFMNDNFMKLTQREEDGGMNGAFFILYLLFILNAATFIYLLIKFLGKGELINWWMILIGVFVVYLVRHTTLYIFSVIFPVEREVKQYNFMIAVFNLIIGFILLPMNLIISYTTDSVGVAALYVTLAILAFIFVIRYSKGILLGLMGYGRFIFQFLLYLCTFEIVPILIIFKVIKNFGSF